MALEPGTRLGPYRILEPLGAGGMGEVYRARDTRLERDVAIKVLPAELSADPDRVRRLEKEARAASTLNHPNIVTIHEIEEVDSIRFIAMELVQGETLRELLRSGPPSAKRLVSLATQAATGLAKAHEAGIVHRDLKPENIMVTSDGLVKILDFGLAKLTQAHPQDEGRSQVPTEEVPTSDGAVGTVGYISPEQIRGQTVDHRADIFAFGAVLYEMISGRRAFRGDTSPEVLTAILNADPEPPDRQDGSLPPGLARIAMRCLEKRPGQRFHSAEDVAFALEALSDPPRASTSVGERPARRWISLAALVGVAVAVGAWFLWPKPQQPRLLPLTNLSGYEDYPALSPDGTRVAFTWDGETGGDREIYVKQIDTESLLRLTHDPGEDLSPVWSPDGGQIAFSRRTESEVTYLLVSALGGPERPVYSFAQSGFRPAVLDWSPDGRTLALTDFSRGDPGGILLLSLETLEARPLVESPEFVHSHTFSPDGRQLAFVQRSASNQAYSDIYVVPATGGEPRRLTSDNRRVSGLTWTRGGRAIVFSSNREGLRRLWRVDASGGSPEPVTSGGEGGARPSMARGADRLAYVREIWDADVWKIEVDVGTRRARRFLPVTDSSVGDGVPHLSPDGSRIAFGSNRSGRNEIWTCRGDGSECVQLSREGGGSPRWSPNGREVAFDGGSGDSNIHVVDARTRAIRQATRDPSEEVLPSWSRDGLWIYFASNRSGTWQVWKVRAEGGEATPVTRDGGFRAIESLDGATLYFSRDLGSAEIWTKSLEAGEESPLLTFPPFCWRCWDVSEEGLYYFNDEGRRHPVVERLDLASGEISPVAELEGRPAIGSPQLSVSPDGQTLLYSRIEADDLDLLLIEDFR